MALSDLKKLTDTLLSINSDLDSIEGKILALQVDGTLSKNDDSDIAQALWIIKEHLTLIQNERSAICDKNA